MAIQQWTILTLVGPAAGDAAGRLERWWQARLSDDPSSFGRDDWPAPVRRAAADYFSKLVDHRWGMPAAYFSQHVDLWSAGGQIQSHLGDQVRHVWHDAGELWSYRLPDGGELMRRNGSAARSAQFPESRWLAQRLIEAAQAYEPLWPEAVVLVNRQAVTVSPTDDELRAAAATLPEWLGDSAAGCETIRAGDPDHRRADGQRRYEGMTVNERLSDAGILAPFVEAARRRDRARLVALLRQVELSQSEAERSVDTLLADPAKYGY